MSSMRNALQRRNHKERSQVSSRLRYGHLEKHKDYTLRARDYNQKKSRLKILKQKAVERNPDEFYYGMLSSTTKDGGVLVKERGESNGTVGAMRMEVVRGLKMQDKAYLRMVGDMERKRRERLQEGMVFVGKEGVVVGRDGEEGEGVGKKTVFDEQGRKVKVKKPKVKPVKMLMDLDSDEMDWEDEDFSEEEKVEKMTKEEKKMAKKREAKYKELDARKSREAELRELELDLDAQREFMGKSAPRTGRTKEGKRWFNNARKK